MTQQSFRKNLKERCALAPGSHVLMAVSGGADSVAMLCLFASVRESYPLTLTCAHVEHGIRGDDSQADCAFVKDLCRELGIAFLSASVDAPAYAQLHGCGMEEAARELRYDCLYRFAKETGADVIALAHHADDQAETVLMRAARGSDLRGLCAMRYQRGMLIRPLLDAHGDELRAYLLSIARGWREDATNADTAYTRNRLRHLVLPGLEEAVPGAGAALCRLARAAQRDEDYFDQQIGAMNLGVLPLVNGAAIKKEEVAHLHPALLSRVLVRLMEAAGLPAQSAGRIEEIMSALGEEEAAVNLSDDAHAHVGRRYLCLTRGEDPQIDVPLAVPGVTDTPFGRFEVREAEPGETGDGRLFQTMPSHLLIGARVTSRREGDTIIPFGRHKSVKLKKLMIDAGIERAMRQSVPIVRRDDKVLLAVGLRPAEYVRGAGDEEERMTICFLGKWPEAEKR